MKRKEVQEKMLRKTRGASDREAGERKERISQLEAKARRLLAKAEENEDLDLPSIQRELSHVLDSIDSIRTIAKRQDQVITREETYVGTELIQMELRTPTYSPHRFPEREKLQRRLGILTKERRRLEREHEDKERSLLGRLVSLLDKHDLLCEDGN